MRSTVLRIYASEMDTYVRNSSLNVIYKELESKFMIFTYSIPNVVQLELLEISFQINIL